ncbi:hypothetical protein [Hyphomonas sp.]|mgnify:CR=1 FL=1|uniref:hypothetical protein n=1 Tax=Hyphomonas sp. TaxID=87 RepID=UPI0025B86B17|nr:hypothetical protein [Hyphomonas sp.]
MANTYLTRTQGTPTNIDKYTFSVWVKRSDIGAGNSKIFSVSSGSASGEEKLEFNQDDLIWRHTDTSGNTNWERVTDRKFRDNSAWLHILVAYDSSLGTAADRCKMYINGVQETSFSSSSNPSQNADSYINKNNSTIYIGRLHSAGSQYFGGVMSHMHFIDGTAYTPSSFGSTDSTTGEWKIKTSPSVTYGNNGFFWLKDNVATTDNSPNSNTFTLGGGTLTKTEDNPSNNFCTLNPLQIPKSNIISSFDNGNTRGRGNSTNGWMRIYGSLGANSGKWWYEVYLIAQNSSGRLGWDSIDKINNGDDNYYSGLTIQSTTGTVRGGIVGTAAYSPDAVQLPADGGGNATFAQGDYLGMGIDLDNNTITVHKNGSPLATNWSFASYNTSVKASTYGTFVAPSANYYSASGEGNQYNFNFGNGTFGSTQLTGTTYQDSNGQGVFKYQPVSNYLAYCTKNLNI